MYHLRSTYKNRLDFPFKHMNNTHSNRYLKKYIAKDVNPLKRKHFEFENNEHLYNMQNNKSNSLFSVTYFYAWSLLAYPFIYSCFFTATILLLYAHDDCTLKISGSSVTRKGSIGNTISGSDPGGGGGHLV